MCKKIILISSFICFFFSFQGIAQQVKTNLYVTVKPCDYLHDRVCESGAHIAEITQEFVLEKHTKDTLFLTLDNYGFMQSLAYPQLYPKLTVEIISKNKKQSVKPNFNGFTLSVPLPISSCTVKVNYLYNSDYAYRSSGATGFYLWSCMPSWHSWYFNYPNMQFNKVEFTNSNDSLLYFFVDVPSSQQNGKMILDTKSIDRDINFFLIQKPFYHKTTCIQNVDTINIYLDKGAILIPNPKGSISNNTVVPGNRVTQALEDSCKNSIKRTLKKINDFFSPLHGTIDIFDADLTINDVITWGKGASDRKNNHHLILIDTSYWHDQSLIHELIHLYNYVPLPEKDSTVYFFNESITEYLAVCFCYEDKQERDLVFNQKIISFARVPNKDYSIFKLSSNSANANTGRGSSLVVYDKTPFIIHTLAQMVGEEKFLAALKQFYAKVAQGMAINLPNFEQILKENGVTDKQWDWFMRNL